MSQQYLDKAGLTYLISKVKEYVNTQVEPKANASALTDYLTKSSASSTYATKTALSSYLTTTSAASTYLSKTTASNTYLTKTTASSTYLTKTTASSTYATKSSLSDYASRDDITSVRNECADLQDQIDNLGGGSSGGGSSNLELLWSGDATIPDESITLSKVPSGYNMLILCCGDTATPVILNLINLWGNYTSGTFDMVTSRTMINMDDPSIIVLEVFCNNTTTLQCAVIETNNANHIRVSAVYGVKV